MTIKYFSNHEKNVEAIRKQLLHSPAEISLKNSIHPSNTTRSSIYKSQTIDINTLNQILEIDLHQQKVIVEPRVTMEQLVKALLKHSVMIHVVPEFKGITVGGAVMGAGIESSSHKWGLFSDTCLAFEILLGDGTVVRATPEQHADLFYGISGSYGSLGILLSIEIRLIPVKPWVKLTYRRESSLVSDADFVEGIVFSPDHIVLIEGNFIDDDLSLNSVVLNKWRPWFYQHVKESSREEKISLYDYLFRHDRGAFWMGAYGTSLSSFLKYAFRSSSKVMRKDPRWIFRSLWGGLMTSQNLYSKLHRAEKWVSEQFIIQDFCIPMEEVFLEKIYQEIGIFPLWLCPAKTTKHAQIFSPHYLTKTDQLVNVGVYGSPKGNVAELIMKLEAWTADAQGRKMLYSQNYYSKENFWNIYDFEAYYQLRQKYSADRFMHIDQKVLG